jgi:flagellar biosynthesis component FlhA
MNEGHDRIEYLLVILSEEIQKTRKLTLEVREENKLTKQIAEATSKKSDAAWELVVMTRNQWRKPFWKRWFGQ